MIKRVDDGSYSYQIRGTMFGQTHQVHLPRVVVTVAGGSAVEAVAAGAFAFAAPFFGGMILSWVKLQNV